MSFGINLFIGKEAVINKVPYQSKVNALTYGLVANLILRDYSTFYRYELQAVVGSNRTTLIDILPSGSVRLKEELESEIPKITYVLVISLRKALKKFVFLNLTILKQLSLHPWLLSLCFNG